MHKTYIIAEIGINHNGSIEIAKQLIDLAVVAGCDAVKFQKRNPEKCVPEHQKGEMRDTPWGKITYLDYKKKIEFEKPEYDEINRYCENKIQWSASPWDLDSLHFLKSYDVPWIKIPSAHLTNEELVKESVEYCYRHNKKLIVSTGMTTQDELDLCFGLITNYTSDNIFLDNNLILMHCNSTYPAHVEELNLSYIAKLKAMYGCRVGYSGHEFRLGTTVAAVYLGAEYIERHITLNRTMWGTDHLSSVEPQGLIKLVSGIRELEAAYGDGTKHVYHSELSARKKLRGY